MFFGLHISWMLKFISKLEKLLKLFGMSLNEFIKLLLAQQTLTLQAKKKRFVT